MFVFILLSNSLIGQPRIFGLYYTILYRKHKGLEKVLFSGLLA
jgi:hypothetical protein